MSRRKRFGADVEQIAQQSSVFGLEQRIVQLVRILRCTVLVENALCEGNVLASGNTLVVPAILPPLVTGKPRQQDAGALRTLAQKRLSVGKLFANREHFVSGFR